MKHASTILILLAGACRAADNLTPLDVKPGLWENTSTTERGGMPTLSPEQMAKLPPEAKARMQAMAGTKTDTSQSCMTADEVSKFGRNQYQSCKVTTVTSTRGKQEFSFECDNGGNKSTGTMKIEAVDSTHVNSLVVINMNAGGRPMNMKITNTSKWLGADCGSVKPASAKE
jgi:Protein of unknown function (DUF3617)